MKGQEAIPSHPTNLQSTERTSERKGVASSENVLAGAKTDAFGASGSVQNAGNWPMNLQDASERERKRSEQWKEKDLPRRTPDEPDGETAVPGGAQRVQERPTGVRDEGAVETNALCRETGPGGHAELQQASRDVKIDLDRQDVVEGAEYDRIGRGCDRSGGDVETNLPDGDEGPGGHLGERDRDGSHQARSEAPERW